MYQLILICHVFIGVIVIALVLIQHGKGADIGAAFGSGASNTLFGSQGTGNFLFKMTAFLAMLFFTTSLTLSYMVATKHQEGLDLRFPKQNSAPVDTIPVPCAPSAPNQ